LVTAAGRLSLSEQVLQLARLAETALAEGRLTEAEDLAQRLEESAPNLPFGPFTKGIARFKAGDYSTAIDAFRTAVNRQPTKWNFHYWLGNSLHHAGLFYEAIEAYKSASGFSQNSDIAYNLNLVKSDAGYDRHGKHLVDENRREFSNDNLAGIMKAARALASKGISPINDIPVSPTTFNSRLSVVTCSVTPSKLERLRASLEKQLTRKDWELVVITDAKSLCEGYSRGLAQSTGELVIFCHDDIEIICDDFYNRLIDTFVNADVVGVCGVTLLNGPALAWAGSPYLHSSVVNHAGDDDSYWPSLASTAGPRIDGAQALDGMFIAARREVADEIGFDAATFDGFDFYDVDFSYRAYKRGFKIRIQTDLHLLHKSRGNFGPKYLMYSERFREKHVELKNSPPFRTSVMQQLGVATLPEAILLGRWVDHWLMSTSSATAPA
jgi:tetratricopeptide (TPR) repeat protein